MLLIKKCLVSLQTVSNAWSWFLLLFLAALVKTTNQAFIVVAGSASSYHPSSTYPQSLLKSHDRSKIMFRWSLAWRLKVEKLNWIVAVQGMW